LCLETPKGRRSLCYDRAALDARKEHKPENNAVEVAETMGIELLTEEQYKQLQSVEHFDLKTSSWVKTPEDVRKRVEQFFVIVVMDEFYLSQWCTILLCDSWFSWSTKNIILYLNVHYSKIF
jgi:hypothetical protein